MEWQPIETAPKDGTWILAYSPKFAEQGACHTHWIVKWQVWAWTWQDQDDATLSEADPTHWMPLPEPPQ